MILELMKARAHSNHFAGELDRLVALVPIDIHEEAIHGKCLSKRDMCVRLTFMSRCNVVLRSLDSSSAGSPTRTELELTRI